MSDMKCPFCNGELVGTIGHPICRNQNCVMCDDPMPQDLLEELTRTRKALEISVDAMTQCSSMRGVELIEIINAALAKIKDTIETKGGGNVSK